MIQICPAILVQNARDFSSQIKEYADLFERIDIDVNVKEDNFDGMVTIDPIHAAELAKDYENYLNFHLMMSLPYEAVQNIKALFVGRLEQIRFIVHQEAKIDKLLEEDSGLIALAVKAETPLMDYSYYEQFSEIQLMTITTGKQGNAFKPEIMDRVEWLRSEGYAGVISLDGSVNAESAKVIKKHEVDRVSVGSYFSKSADVEKDRIKLDKLLNG